MHLHIFALIQYSWLLSALKHYSWVPSLHIYITIFEFYFTSIVRVCGLGDLCYNKCSENSDFNGVTF